MRIIYSHAWHRTFSSFGGFGWIYSIIAIPIVGLALHYLVAGSVAMNAELQIYLIYGLAAAGVVFTSVFSWNLICAPFRIERDAHNRTKEALGKIKAQVPKNKPRKLNQEQISSLSDTIKSVGVVPEAINVLYFNSSVDCADFAEDIGDAIKKADIKCLVHHGPMYEHDARDRGIKINYCKSGSLTPLAEAFQNKLKEFGFSSEKRHVPDAGGIFFLYIARSSDSD